MKDDPTARPGEPRRSVGADDRLIITDDLFTRSQRIPDLAAEVEAVGDLARLIATEPQAASQRILELAVALCRAGSARLSMAETKAAGATRFAWAALAGAVAPHRGVLSCDAALSELCPDQTQAILVSRPGRLLPELDLVEPAIHEALIVPLVDAAQGRLGTLWLFCHDTAGGFDATDASILERLAGHMVLALKVARDADEHARIVMTKEAALQDAHHRVKNTIQVTASLLRMQAGRSRSPEARDALTDAVGRLTVLAGVHELLYRSANGQRAVDLPMLVGTLADGLRQFFPEMSGQVQLRVEVDGVSLDPDRAIPLALVVNEAVTNAYKHAFPDGRSEEIVVGLKKVGIDGTGALVLTVRDDGVGLPSKARDGSLGLKLIQRFGEQLNAELGASGDGHKGTTITLRLPLSPP